MPAADYFLGSRYLGRSRIPQNPDRLTSLVWICEGCGQDWARVVVESALWAVEHNRCEACGPAHQHDWRVPGSILRQWFFLSADLMGRNQAMALENLPPDLVAREFKLALTWAERRAQAQTS